MEKREGKGERGKGEGRLRVVRECVGGRCGWEARGNVDDMKI